MPRKRQFHLGIFARIGSAFAIAIALIFVSTLSPNVSGGHIAYAGDTGQSGDASFCIVATVISHDEKPLNGTWNITVSSPGGMYQPIDATTGGSNSVRFDLPSGPWHFELQVPDGYMAITPASFDITIEPTFTGCHEVRFKLKRIVPVIVIKLDQNHKPLPGWVIRADPGPGFPLAKAMPIEATTNASGEASFQLTVGDWVFSEKAPAGTMFTPVVPVNGTIGVSITAPGPHRIYFKNKIEPKGCIDVYKWAKAEPESGGVDFPLAQWEITLLRADGSVVDTKWTNINGRVRFDQLPFGPYMVAEEQRIGWRPAGPPKVNVVVNTEGCTRAYPAPSVEVVFENYQDHSFCMEGRKIDENGGVGLPGWIITSDPVEVGGFKPANVVTDGLGKYRIELPQDDYRIPGSTYKVCELPQAGWENVSATCHTVKIWDRAGMCEPVPDFINRQKPIPTVVIPPIEKPEPKQPTPTPTYPPPTVTPPPPTVTPTPKHPHYPPKHPHCSAHHVVAKGEGLFAIGTKYGKSAQEMINANPEVRKNRHWFVYVGQKLCIP